MDKVFNMDETLILFYLGKDKVIVTKGTEQVRSLLVPVENDKKGVALAVTHWLSLLVLLLYFFHHCIFNVVLNVRSKQQSVILNFRGGNSYLRHGLPTL